LRAESTDNPIVLEPSSFRLVCSASLLAFAQLFNEFARIKMDEGCAPILRALDHVFSAAVGYRGFDTLVLGDP